ncbi:hypothetical protein RB614_25025 [Phytohabitans sp. ZYX-F-186]|uniref:Uncharacterized protein n=1 Tax=Phytohabitans maris TaxID=3071409 RepID=A0ABU0ZL74_9ACTN|nr:hypothetical protein [Phytohabitans sp. ZYX-F-186]MDQ7907789.1 hypothetical protein [Phytohabitans sp. ZYX-F-186]
MSRFRVTPVFDAVDGDEPYFSPDRRRVLDGAERARLLTYLAGAPLVLRAHGLEPDPLDPSAGQAVPVGFQTDGVWIWQEATVYYLRRYGIAPEDDLVRHIEAAGYTLPAQLADEVLDDAADAALAPAASPAPDVRRDVRYFADVPAGGSAEDPGGLSRQWHQTWRDGEDVRIDQVCDPALRWRDTGAFASNARGGEHDFVEIPQRLASRILDRWWAEEHTDAS